MSQNKIIIAVIIIVLCVVLYFGLPSLSGGAKANQSSKVLYKNVHKKLHNMNYKDFEKNTGVDSVVFVQLKQLHDANPNGVTEEDYKRVMDS